MKASIFALLCLLIFPSISMAASIREQSCASLSDFGRILAMQRDHGVSLRNALSLIDQMAQNSVRVLEESMAESIWVGPLSQSNPAEVAQYSYEVCEQAWTTK